MEKRVHVIPLRRETLKVGLWRRAPKAVKALRVYALKHYRTDKVRVGKYLNEKLWERGTKHPPSKVKVVAIKENDKVFMELEDKYVEPKKDEVKKEVKAEKGADDKKIVEEKKEEPVKEEKKEETPKPVKKTPVKKASSEKK